MSHEDDRHIQCCDEGEKVSKRDGFMRIFCGRIVLEEIVYCSFVLLNELIRNFIEYSLRNTLELE